MEKRERLLPTSPEARAELEALRAEVKRREEALRLEGEREPRSQAVKETVAAVREPIAKDIPAPEGIVLKLSPEVHDTRMGELIGVLQEKGIKKAFEEVLSTRNPHLIDDFHRVLVEYLHEGHPSDIAPRSRAGRELAMVLYEVSLPEVAKKEEQEKKPLKELVSSMEQFYQGMIAVGGGGGSHHFSIELAVPNSGERLSFYVAVPREKVELFEKQIVSIFPHAKIRVHQDDYNIFNEEGSTVGAEATYGKRMIFSLKGYDEFDYDPLNAILSSFAKLAKVGEGAAIQLVVSPRRGDWYLRKFQHALHRIHRGVIFQRATDVRTSFLGQLWVGFKDFFFNDKRKRHSQYEEGMDQADKKKAENIEKKTSSPIVLANLRILVSTSSVGRSRAVLADLAASFNQFEDTFGNKLYFNEYSGGRLRKLAQDFIFRRFTRGSALPLSTKEATTMIHFPPIGIETAPELKQAKAGVAAAPVEIPQEGVHLGVNKFRAKDTQIYLTPPDRLRHFYVIGQTGTGKSTLLKNMVIQDIEAGKGVCMIDPHGTDIVEVLSRVPKERYEDVIYFDPAATERPMGLNMLEYDTRFPDLKTFVVNEMFGIFKKLYKDVPESMGPLFEQYFRNATMLVIEDPETGSTLLDISRVMADADFRALKLSRCKNPIVIQFWRDIAEKTGGEHALQNMVPWITSKFDVFLSNDIMRPIVVQEKSAFNFREIMDDKKILLVNLAKGRLGDINANLLGLIIVGKILMAALSRVDSFGKELPPFYLYIDEFQNFTTDSIATIFSEARKYGLSLTVAHQFIAQLEEKIRDAVFGNVGSLCSFRVGPEDAEFLEKQFGPTFTKNDIMNLDNHNAYVRLLVRGRPEKPFNFETLPFSVGNLATVDSLKELSYLKYGRSRSEIEAEISARYEDRSVLDELDETPAMGIQ